MAKVSSRGIAPSPAAALTDKNLSTVWGNRPDEPTI